MKDDIKKLFKDADLIREYYPEYDGEEYEDMMVKEAYEDLPEITYPNVIIYESVNLPANKFWDGEEFATSLTYQFTINCEQSANHTANQNVRIIQDIIDRYIQNGIYNCFRRVGYSPASPTTEDVNVRCGNLRYDCNLVASQNTIYRRY